MRLNELADLVDEAGDLLAGAGAAVADVDPGVRAFGGEAPGALGESGRTLHRQLTAALAARGREAAAHGARLTDTAAELRAVAAGYDDADHTAGRRHDGGAA